jgi:ubiquinone/menaquinone biosynthesis C-methylase UbiE
MPCGQREAHPTVPPKSPMAKEVDLYDGHYGHLGADPQVEVRRETYDEDLGQSSWITGAEARRWFELLRLGRGQKALEVACGSGGVTCAMARHTGAACVGVDINANGIQAAKARTAQEGLDSLVSFQRLDASGRLPFNEAAFDAVFSNDAILHLPDRAGVLVEWHRLLVSGGRLLYTDPAVVTGPLSNEEIRTRSSIGFYLYLPPGENERLLRRAGFRVLEVEDVTEAVASVSKKWRDARARRREQLTALEGEGGFEGLQRFLEAVHKLSSERRLSRFMYLAEK